MNETNGNRRVIIGVIVAGVLMLVAFIGGATLPPISNSNQHRGWIMVEIRNDSTTEQTVGVLIVGDHWETCSDAYTVLSVDESLVLGIEIRWTENNHFTVTAFYKNATSKFAHLSEVIEGISGEVVDVTIVLREL